MAHGRGCHPRSRLRAERRRRSSVHLLIGKAERGPVAIDAIRRHQSAYLIAIDGAAYLVSKAIRKARVVAFEDLAMEAIHEFEIRDMPVTVAVDSTGESVHETGPRIWRERITGGAPRTREIQLRSEISEIALGLMLKSPGIGR